LRSCRRSALLTQGWDSELRGFPVLPLDERIADAADEAELDDIYETERRLLYVACTRAREHLLLTGVTPVSEYLGDLKAEAG
jgi:ATP-dependent exoDNAse (exonuclease V) beta subunit